MKLNWINQQNSPARSIALGTFDGVHRGHQKLLMEAISRKPREGTSCVLTFDIPPEQFFRGELCLVSSFERRVELLRSFGIDEVTWLAFGSELTTMPAHYFVKEILVDIMQAKEVICGYNYRFGEKRSGNPTYLKEQGKQYGFAVTVIPPVQDQGGQAISSTKIRQLISDGDLHLASKYLGYYPTYQGQLVDSALNCLGLEVHPNLVLPIRGLYLVWCVLGQERGQAAIAQIRPKRKISLTFLAENPPPCPRVLDIQFLSKLKDEESCGVSEIDLSKAQKLLEGFHLQGGEVVLR